MTRYCEKKTFVGKPGRMFVPCTLPAKHVKYGQWLCPTHFGKPLAAKPMKRKCKEAAHA